MIEEKTILNRLKKLNKNNTNIKKEFELNCITNYDLNPNGILLASNKYAKLMTCRYEIIGTFNKKACTWRWSWGNDNIPCKLSKIALKTIKYGEDNNDHEFVTHKVNGNKHAMKYIGVASMYDKSITGYMIYNKENIDIYIVLKNCRLPSKKRKKTQKKETNCKQQKSKK
jgi:hypothetical protein